MLKIKQAIFAIAIGVLYAYIHQSVKFDLNFLVDIFFYNIVGIFVFNAIVTVLYVLKVVNSLTNKKAYKEYLQGHSACTYEEYLKYITQNITTIYPREKFQKELKELLL